MRLARGSQDWSHVLGELRLGDRRGGGAGERAPGALEAELTSSVVRTAVEVTERACPRTPDDARRPRPYGRRGRRPKGGGPRPGSAVSCAGPATVPCAPPADQRLPSKGVG